MTKFKVCSKIHLFIIISCIFIIVGLAVGTICHYISNGFFNYGGEFASYKSVTVTYYNSEYKDADEIKPLCDEQFKGLNAYEVSISETVLGGEIVYKFSPATDTASLRTAADGLQSKMQANVGEDLLSSAAVFEAKVSEGGSRAITFASIALASAAAFQFIYFVLRYKLRAAYSALLASVHNLGIFVALMAITRIPLGIEAVAVGGAVVLLTMILTCVLFDRTRKNFNNEKYAKADRLEVVDASATEVRMTTVIAIGALAVAALIFGVFAAISSLYIGALAPYVTMLLGMIACYYGTVFFTPAVHGGVDAICEKVVQSMKESKKRKSSSNKAKSVKADKSTNPVVESV